MTPEEVAFGKRLVEEAHREARKYAPPDLLRPQPQRFIHYTELGDCAEGSPIRQEWNTFLRELPRLLAEGGEGRFALIKGDEVIGIFDTSAEGEAEGRSRYLMKQFIVQPIREWEPLLKIRNSW